MSCIDRIGEHRVAGTGSHHTKLEDDKPVIMGTSSFKFLMAEY